MTLSINRNEGSRLKPNHIVSAVPLAALAAIVFASGCAGLSSREKEQVRDLNAVGIDSASMGTNNGWAAGLLNLLPGIGNFYLATGTNESPQVLYGVLNIVPGWFVWPFSCLWAIPQGAIDANNINQRQTVDYYYNTERGTRELAQARARRSSWTEMSSMAQPTSAQAASAIQAGQAQQVPPPQAQLPPVSPPQVQPVPTHQSVTQPPPPQRRFWCTVAGASVLKSESEARLLPLNTPAMPENQVGGWSTIGVLLPQSSSIQQPPPPPAPLAQRRFWCTINGTSVLKNEAEARQLPPSTPAMPENQVGGWTTIGNLLSN